MRGRASNVSLLKLTECKPDSLSAYPGVQFDEDKASKVRICIYVTASLAHVPRARSLYLIYIYIYMYICIEDAMRVWGGIHEQVTFIYNIHIYVHIYMAVSIWF